MKYEKIPEFKEIFNLGAGLSVELDEKLDVLERVVSLTLDLKNMSLGTLKSSLVSDAENKESESLAFKEVIGHLNLSEKILSDKASSLTFFKSYKSDI